MDTSAKAALGPLDVSKRAAKVTTHRGDVVGATVGETTLGGGPDGFIGVELRGVGREIFEMQPREPAADFPNALSFVDTGVVPDHDEMPAEVAQKVSEEFAHLVVPDVFRVALKVQADATPPGGKGDARDHGEAIMAVAMMNDGRLTARSPGLSHCGDQEEA